MATLTLKRKLAILSDAAKYDASCASSGSVKRDSMGGKGMGSTDGGMGICHAYAPDGRCISLLKILLTNFCVYDCAYCVNRVSSNTPRARFSVEEVVDLTLSFYKRNYIEGLFLSSGIIRTADYTMEEMVRVARSLREVHDFRGYIHLKLIPEASPALVNQAGLYADRVSINVELPKDESLAALAPEKDAAGIKKAMGAVRVSEDAAKDKGRKTRPPKFAPAGQSTQMIVGADDATDGAILKRSESLYGAFRLRRVYYSAFSPIPDATARLPLQRPPLIREHRLYQADWLMRFYGFARDEIIGETEDLDLAIDPKLAWALKNRGEFPMDVNVADRERLLRVPGLGVRAVDRIVDVRRYKRLELADVKRLSRGIEKLKPFLVCADWSPGALTDRADLRQRVQPKQMDLF
ncbi:MAG: putative DNA modification/repair radical SAM protein [Alphaproteobacteria bacterium]|nr:putative DNA modification/repair radical SAM protein [Alphaproteobacteria bacterium]MBU1515554.1 putative DNA modification/repair radical SAM protein [Alphaproteobacteria bacterium]MBU2095552.1 putative DNA modification/repair radical SAM protein [Alphaproteobacteria bacterium]MBU2150793.1 putative DNA modification/repair radical SAM protein [Alphaproteobacteria bacterium]MBU2307058.1 putative DNA modification/repair radical SAM protein [Alphaproteobacteria bacterium]